MAGEVDIDRKGRIERPELEVLERALERRQPSQPVVAPDARLDHLARPVDGDHIGARPQHQPGGDAMAAADLQHAFARPGRQ